MDRPNIVYFVVHDLGKHIPPYGAPVEAPNLEAFAAESVKFNSAFCNAPACTPSRCCAMTGLYAHTSGGVGLAHMGWPLPHEVPTVVDYLNNAGYETIHSGMEHERHPRDNHYQTDLEKHWVHYNAHRGVNAALTYLEEREDERPFYLNVGSQQPHGSTWGKAEDLYGGPVPPEKVYLPPYLPDREPLRRRFGRFQAAIRYMDEHFGHLLEGLERLGHADDTLVVFTTDHGIAAPRSKGTLYDRGVEITLLVRLPGGRMGGAEVRHLVQNIDFVPTLLEAVGAPRPDALQGRSFWPLLDDGDYTPHDAIFIERNFHGEARVYGRSRDYVDRYDPVRAVRTPEFHYIKRFDPRVKRRPWLPWEVEEVPPEQCPGTASMPEPREPRPEEELYHVRLDPQEFVNVAARPEFAAVKDRLKARLSGWMEETDDFVLRGEVPQRREEPSFGIFDDIPGDEQKAREEGWFD
ncbi:MAG: sulfatase [Planctomycetota bacterium]